VWRRVEGETGRKDNCGGLKEVVRDRRLSVGSWELKRWRKIGWSSRGLDWNSRRWEVYLGVRQGLGDQNLKRGKWEEEEKERK
jgi:hypothetical protein